MENSRVIKFRAWHGIGGDETNGMTMTYWKLGSGLDNSVFFHNAKAVMQFTGLKDKNGKEIYEGDIVRDLRGSIPFSSQVIFKEEMAAFVLKDNQTSGAWFTQESAKEKEVIGNLYENPELLEK